MYVSVLQISLNRYQVHHEECAELSSTQAVHPHPFRQSVQRLIKHDVYAYISHVYRISTRMRTCELKLTIKSHRDARNGENSGVSQNYNTCIPLDI